MTQQSYREIMEGLTGSVNELRREVTTEIKGMRQDVTNLQIQQATLAEQVHGNGFGIVGQISEVKDVQASRTTHCAKRLEACHAEGQAVHGRITTLGNRVWWILGIIAAGGGGLGVGLWQVAAHQGSGGS